MTAPDQFAKLNSTFFAGGRRPHMIYETPSGCSGAPDNFHKLVHQHRVDEESRGARPQSADLMGAPYFGLSASRIACTCLGSTAGGSTPERSTCNNWPTLLLRVPQPRFIASVNSS